MNGAPVGRIPWAAWLMAGACLVSSCSPSPEAPTETRRVVTADALVGAGKPVSGPSVTAADPPFGHEGDVSKQVTITGSGFVTGAQASWERGGVPDGKILVVSTRYVSSTELVATISIAPDAALGLYDIAVVNPDRKKGIGYSLFEVTQANVIAGTEFAYAVNTNGAMTGRVGVAGAFFFDFTTGLDTLGSPGRGYSISEDGLTVVGGTTNNAPNAQAYLYSRVGAGWQRTTLPKDPASCIATARTVASDPLTGSAVLVGGVENMGCYNKANLRRQPRLWVPIAGTWTKKVLPGGSNTDDLLDDVNATGVAVGTVSGRAAVWNPDGAGSWTVTLIGSSGSALHAINKAGTIAVGETNGVAKYWTWSGTAWTGPFALPSSCTSAIGVDDSDRILANGCADGSKKSPAVIVAPYLAANVTLLGGLGSTSGGTTAEGMSPQGGWVAGHAILKSTTVGVYWKVF